MSGMSTNANLGATNLSPEILAVVQAAVATTMQLQGQQAQRGGGQGQIYGGSTSVLPPQSQQQNLQTQSIFDDIGDFFTKGPGSVVVNTVGQTLAQQLPNILGGLLSSLGNDPQFQQSLRQAAASQQTSVNGVTPQSIFGDIGNWFQQTIPGIVKQAVPVIIQNLPTIISTAATLLQAEPRVGQQASQARLGAGSYSGNNFGLSSMSAQPRSSWN